MRGEMYGINIVVGSKGDFKLGIRVFNIYLDIVDMIEVF